MVNTLSKEEKENRLQVVRDVIARDPKVEVRDIARDLGVHNPDSLSLYFKRNTGRTIKEYRAGVRLEDIKEALSAASSKEDAATRAGFSSVGNMSAYLRTHLGMSIEEYMDSQVELSYDPASQAPVLKVS